MVFKEHFSGSTIVSDGLQCFDAVVDAQCIHETHIVGGGKQAAQHPAFKWVNTILGNVKNFLTGTYNFSSDSRLLIPVGIIQQKERIERQSIF